jgi:ABC-type sugar transport system ATPase subunit
MRVLAERITKAFAGTRALHDVSIEIESGSIHGLVGENGAGKSTLGKIIAGIMRPDSGKILLDGTEVQFGSPREALASGVAIVLQELALVPHLSVDANVFLGNEPVALGFVRHRELRRNFEKLLKEYGFDIEGSRRVGTLSVAQRQQVEILKAVVRKARLIIMDEPTSSLTPTEVAKLHGMIRRLKEEQGTTFIYVTHSLSEMLGLCDKISILRNGRHIRTGPIAQECESTIIAAMLGRDIEHFFPEKKAPKQRSAPIVSVRNLTRRPAFHDISLDVYPGEIVGMTGLLGSGRSEVARAMFGADPIEEGRIDFDGKPIRFRSPRKAIKMGMAMVPESRRDQGLHLTRSIIENIALMNFATERIFGFVAPVRERKKVHPLIRDLSIKCSSLEAPVASLSGGNQQKVLFAKWIAGAPRLLILDEPTRGVDIGAKVEIYRLIVELADRGIGILMITSELEEVIGLCHRVLVIRQGRIVSRLEGDQIDRRVILEGSLGSSSPRPAVH